MDYKLFTPLIPFVIGIVLKVCLDRNLGAYLVKYLYWMNVRSIFRMKVENIAGEWVQIWHNALSQKYPDDRLRTSKMSIKQFGSYMYAEFRSNNDEEYYIYGEIIGRNIIGKWRDKNSDLGYFGALEMRIVDNQYVNGIWCGHSHEKPNEIYSDHWEWKRM